MMFTHTSTKNDFCFNIELDSYSFKFSMLSLISPEKAAQFLLHWHSKSSQAKTFFCYRLVFFSYCKNNFMFEKKYNYNWNEFFFSFKIGSSDDGAHSQNEKINITNYIEGVSKESMFKLYEWFIFFINLYFFFLGEASWNLFPGGCKTISMIVGFLNDLILDKNNC